jgi:hypothetical protein
MTSSDLETKKTLKTVSMIKRPGGIFHHQAVRQAPESRALCKIPPQEMLCGGPKPRNDKVASAMIATPTMMASSKKTRGKTLGKMCRYMMRKSEAPATRAALTKGLSERESTWLRMSRATVRQVRSATARMTMVRLGSKRRTRIIAKGSKGIPYMTSTAHQEGLGATAIVAGDKPHVGADQDDQQRADKAHQQGDARAVDVLAEEVAAEMVGAEEVLAARRGELVHEPVRAQSEGGVAGYDGRAEVALGQDLGAGPNLAVVLENDPVAPDGERVALIADPAGAQGAGVGGGVFDPIVIDAPHQRAALADDESVAGGGDSDVVQVAKGGQALELDRRLGRHAERQAALADRQRRAINVEGDAC